MASVSVLKSNVTALSWLFSEKRVKQKKSSMNQKRFQTLHFIFRSWFSMSSVDDDSVPELPPDSPGSSVSSRLMVSNIEGTHISYMCILWLIYHIIWHTIVLQALASVKVLYVAWFHFWQSIHSSWHQASNLMTRHWNVVHRRISVAGWIWRTTEACSRGSKLWSQTSPPHHGRGQGVISTANQRKINSNSERRRYSQIES